MAFLRHLYNGETVNVVELTNELVIGRHQDCVLRVEDPTVSGHHARVGQQDGSWYVTDMGSTNGTLVKGDKITSQPLEEGMVFTVGTHAFEFTAQEPADLDKTRKIKKSWIPGVYYTE